jgi:hypothetical protein
MCLPSVPFECSEKSAGKLARLVPVGRLAECFARTLDIARQSQAPVGFDAGRF